MAKVTGPLMSMGASGKFGGALVFGTWKGRNVVHKLVKPANPMTTGQETARNRMRVIAKGIHYAQFTAQLRAGETQTDKEQLMAVAPAGYAWNGNLAKVAIGEAGLAYAAANTAWSALAAGEKTAWDTAAAALTPAIPTVPQYAAGGAAATAATPGETFFHYAYGLYLAGLYAVPGAVPPTYA